MDKAESNRARPESTFLTESSYETSYLIQCFSLSGDTSSWQVYITLLWELALLGAQKQGNGEVWQKPEQVFHSEV